jgi:uncharacterized protein (DUF952 family)/nitroreductase
MEVSLEQALRTTGAVRKFAARPVPDTVVHHLLDTARFAPNGGNRQAWRVVVVKDAGTRRRLRDLYLPGWYEYLAIGAAGLVPWAPVTDRAAEAAARAGAGDIAAKASGGFAEEFDQVPVLLVLLADLRRLAAADRDLDRYTLVGGASIYPFAWSILLAAHGAGLGGVLTTMLVPAEDAVRDLLGVPDGWAVAGALALGYPAGPRPTRLTRSSVAEFTTVDRFDGAPLDPPSPLYHLALQGEWDEAVRGGDAYRRSTLGMSLDEQGFIHCSFASQLQGIADRFYRGRHDVVLLTIDPDRLDAEVRVEDLAGAGATFPHIYGPLPLDAVIQVGRVPLGPDGHLDIRRIMT